MKFAFALLLRLSMGLLLLVGLCLTLGVQARPAHAQSTLTVTDCSGETGPGQIGTVISSASAGDTITFSCNGTIPISSTLTISKNLTLDGSGQSVTLYGQNQGQVLVVNRGVTFTLNALSIAHGSFTGLYNNAGTVSISNSTFANNSAPTYSLGGGLTNDRGTVSISNSTFANNSAGAGGGLANFLGTMTISNSTFANNSAYNGGGGLLNSTSYGYGTMTISNSTFVNNSASNGGGLRDESSGLTISNSTFSGNSATDGGGLFILGGTMTISNSTIANNSANNGDGGLYNNGIISISGSIVATNTGGNCWNDNTVTDQGYNLESSTDCGFTGTGDLQNSDPKLDPNGLQNHGGPTQTIALQQGSPAIDQIPAAQCPSTDQRGDARPDNAETTCDIGAYESNYDDDLRLTNVPASIMTNATSPQGAVVTYTPPTATDESGDNPTATVTCIPASGSTFAIGTTTVTCTATDSDDTNSPVSGSFQVVVKGATAQVSDLVNTVNSFQLSGSLQNALDVKLNATLTDIKAGQTATACSDLSDFIGQVQAKIGKGITQSQANQLIAAAKQVQAVLGC